MAKNAWCTVPGVGGVCWFRFKIQDGKHYGGCSLCMEYAAAGHALSGRQALGRFELDVASSSTHTKDSIDRHVSKTRGDHAKAVAWKKAQISTASSAEGAPELPGLRGHQEALKTCRTDELQENAVYLGYECIRAGLTGEQYAVIAKAAYRLGATLPNAYATGAAYAEMIDASGFRLFADVISCVKGSPALAVNADEGQGHLSLRVNYLDTATFEPKTDFFQIRKVQSLDHEGLCNAVITAFTEPPTDKLCEADMLSKRELAEKLVAFTADGASVMGALFLFAHSILKSNSNVGM